MKKLYLTLLILLFASPVHALEPLKVTYSLYASGFNLVDIDGTYTINDDTYVMDMNLKTVGLLGKLAPWVGELNSNGINAGDKSTPLLHKFASTWRDETETTSFKFNKKGELLSHVKQEDDGKIKDKMPPKEVYKDKPIDMLSAMFRAMNKDSCETIEPVLDGKRRFDMSFISKGKDTLTKSRYSKFSGETEICEVEIIPIAGKWRDKPRGWMSIQNQAKGKGQLPKLWFGKVRDDMPAIPVRFLIKTNYGTMVMHLKSVI